MTEQMTDTVNDTPFAHLIEECTGAVKIEDDSTLCCPYCGEQYLHHREVTVFRRIEDDPDTEEVTVSTQPATAPTVAMEVECLNPSSRRDGLAITFECEHCLERPEFAIAQHKGQSFMAWRHRGTEKLRSDTDRG
jgi:hypothetical protein